MRRILIDHARKKATARQAIDLDSLAVAEPPEDLLALEEALDRLAAQDALKADLVKLRYFVGLTLEEAAAALGMSERTDGRPALGLRPGVAAPGRWPRPWSS
jgi:DNA-directed RNA polymerase specialized sigma24 family protein